MIIIINPENEKKVLTILATYRNFLRTDKIVYYTRLPKHLIEEILDKFERLRYIITTPIKKIKKPHEFIKDIAKSFKPSEIYTVSEKEYRLTRAGLNYFNLLKENSNPKIFSFMKIIITAKKNLKYV